MSSNRMGSTTGPTGSFFRIAWAAGVVCVTTKPATVELVRSAALRINLIAHDTHPELS